MRIDVCAAALGDLDGIYNYTFGAHSQAQARRYIRGIWPSFDRLAVYSQIGQARDDLKPDLRSFAAEEHRILSGSAGPPVDLAGAPQSDGSGRRA